MIGRLLRFDGACSWVMALFVGDGGGKKVREEVERETTEFGLVMHLPAVVYTYNFNVNQIITG